MATDFTANNIVVARIQNRRGNRVNLPQPLEPGELGWCLDTKQLFIGLDAQDAISGLELYKGQILNGQSIVQGIIDSKIVQFTTKKRRLYNAIQLLQDSTTTANESDLLDQLGLLPSSIFVDTQNSDVVSSIEQNIGLLRDLRTVIMDCVDYGANHGHLTTQPGYIDFKPATLITYAWEEIVQTQAVANVAQSGDIVSGAITHISIDNAGLGYIIPPTVTISNFGGGGSPGSGATAHATLSTDGEGRITGFVIDTTGSGYASNTVITIAAPSQTVITATATANIASGSITSISIVNNGGFNGTTSNNGSDGFYKGIPEVTISGDGHNAKAVAIVDLNTKKLTGFTITNSGTGYTTATVTIQEPLSDSLYAFTYDVGLGDMGESYAEMLANGSLHDYDNNSSAIDGRLEYFINYLNTSALPGPSTPTNPILESPLSGVLGDSANPYLNSYDNTMISGFLFLSTPRQSSNVAALVNALGNYDKGYVSTKQNVEIITELTATGSSADTFYDTVFTYDLPASASFVRVDNSTNVYTSLPLEYSVDSSDTQIIEYSIHSTDFQQTGKLVVICNPLISATPSTLSDESVEIRNAAVLNDPSAPDIEFSTSYNSITRVVSVRYRHNFPTNMTMTVISHRWKSF